MKKIKLSSLIKENPKVNKSTLNEGMFNSAIVGILKLIYSGKIKEITKNIEPINKELAQNLESLAKTVEKFNKFIDKPEIIDVFKKYGVDITTLPRLK